MPKNKEELISQPYPKNIPKISPLTYFVIFMTRPMSFPIGKNSIKFDAKARQDLIRILSNLIMILCFPMKLNQIFQQGYHESHDIIGEEVKSL